MLPVKFARRSTRLSLSVLVALLALLLPLPAAPASDEGCFACHGDLELARQRAAGLKPTLAQERAAYQGSAHATLTCAQCHPDVRRLPHTGPAAPVDCAACHNQADIAGAYRGSAHGKAVARGDPEAARCLDCHDAGRRTPRGHDISLEEEAESATYRTNIPQTCARCHGNVELLTKHGISPQHSAQLYLSSAHGQAVAAGNFKAAVCTDCHGSHGVQPATDERAPMARRNVPRTCGACHQPEYGEYLDSIHGRAAATGSQDAPVCTSCHGEHTIRRPEDPASSVYPTKVPATCAKCHANEVLNRRYDMPQDRLGTYEQSYHGVASRYGNVKAANCASCHHAHGVLPRSDPRSSISPANLPGTCAKCHPGATANFARGTIHLAITPESSKPVYYVTKAYQWIIILTMAALLGHILLDLWCWLRKERPRRRPKAAFNPDPRDQAPSRSGQKERAFQRFSYPVLLQHGVLFVCVLLLIITGLPLKYPDSWVTRQLFGIPLGMQLAGFLHRVGAIGLIGVALFHAGYVLLSRDGRYNLKHLIPKVKDVTDVLHNVLYFFGLRPGGARFGRFGYIEKFEYWALVWGSVIMVASGLVLWFFTPVLRLLPELALEIARAAHSWEALLAALSIMTWHFYNVHFCPDHFPFNWLWNDGTITESQLKKRHPLEYEQITGESADTSGATADR